MTPTDIVKLVGGWQHVLAFTPGPGDGSPEIAWGDTYFYYSPSGTMPQATQPFATIVTKNYPGDERSELDRDGVYRVNIHPSKKSFARYTSPDPNAVPDQIAVPNTTAGQVDVAAALDHIIEHPVYGSLGWLAVLNPGPETLGVTRELLREAYELDRTRYERRHTTP
jgi:hypothetical protein